MYLSWRGSWRWSRRWVLEMVWVELWESSQGELRCRPSQSLSNRTPVELEAKLFPSVPNPNRNRMVAKSLSLTTDTQEVGSGATSSEDSTS